MQKNSLFELTPLENSVILDFVFERCSTKELKLCRQVSKLWYKCSLKAWRSSIMITIDWSWVGQQPDGCSFSDFLDYVEKHHDKYLEFPFANHFCVDEDNTKFWNLCGSFIKALEIDRTTFASPDAFRNAIFTSCPNLKKLTLRSVEFDGDQVPIEPTTWKEPMFGENRNLKYLKLLCCYNEGGISWMELLCHFPSMEVLILEWSITNPDALLKAVKLIRKQFPEKLKLNHIETCRLITDLDSTVFSDVLLNTDLKIKHLEIKSAHINADAHAHIRETNTLTLKTFIVLGD